MWSRFQFKYSTPMFFLTLLFIFTAGLCFDRHLPGQECAFIFMALLSTITTGFLFGNEMMNFGNEMMNKRYF